MQDNHKRERADKKGEPFSVFEPLVKQLILITTNSLGQFCVHLEASANVLKILFVDKYLLAAVLATS